MPERAIGVFDSGVGGLTVLRELRRQIPEESFVYLGDTARVPYGTKSPRTVLKYASEAVQFLLNKRVKMIILACNTASAVALEQMAQCCPVPIVGVIEPGARKATEISSSGCIGVVGTEGTVRSGAYEQVIKEFFAEARVYSKSCPLFVPLAEEGWGDHAVAKMVAEEYLTALLNQRIDTLVLGCTHYPMLKPVLQDVVGESVRLVDSAEETATLVKRLLSEQSLLKQAESVMVDYFVTDVSDRFIRVASAFLGEPLQDVKQISLD